MSTEPSSQSVYARRERIATALMAATVQSCSIHCDAHCDRLARQCVHAADRLMDAIDAATHPTDYATE